MASSSAPAAPTRFGICGTGNIASDFACALRSADPTKCVLVAVGSRSDASARSFAATHGIEAAGVHGSYEALATAEDVDAVYIGTPNSTHAACCELFLNHGKAVLCEKPFAVNAAEALRVVSLARERRVLLMEGMWTRHFPAIKKAVALVRDGTIGDVTGVTASFGFAYDADDWDGPLSQPEMGGGILLDIGVYPLAFAVLVAAAARVGEAPEAGGAGDGGDSGGGGGLSKGARDDGAAAAAKEGGGGSGSSGGGSGSGSATAYSMMATASLRPSGVDESVTIELTYPGTDTRPSLVCTATATATEDLANEAVIKGSTGSITVPSPFWAPEAVVRTDSSGGATRYDYPLPVRPSDAPGDEENFPNTRGMCYQAEALHACRVSGQTECPDVPLGDTLALMQLLDSVRASIGVVFPQDAGAAASTNT